MSHRPLHGSPAVARVEEQHVPPRTMATHDHRAHIADTAVAQSFYCDVLQGRQVWPSERTADRTLWFQIGNDLIAVRRDRDALMIPARLVVNDPTAIAERCWDAGYTVQVREAASGEVTFVVTDPFGRRLVLLPHLAVPGADPAAGLTLREEST